MQFPREEELKRLSDEVKELQKQWYEFEALKATIEAKKMDPDAIITAYILRVNKLCYQGGTGYRFDYSAADVISPSHWVVKRESYHLAQPTEMEALAISFKKFYPKFICKVATKLTTEHWGN